jgi:hypothetical protein
MAENKRSPMTTWIIVAIVGIIVLLFAGLLPLPGQKDKVTSHSEPAPTGQSPQPEAPKGPPHVNAPGATGEAPAGGLPPAK